MCFRFFRIRNIATLTLNTVIIKALVADSDPSFLGVAKECVMEMMGKGLQPSASSYTAVYEAFSRQEKMEEAKQFLGEMKAKGFVADNKAMRAMRLVLKGKGAVIKSITDILFSDELEDYSDDSDDDDEIQNYSEEMESRFPPDSYLSFSKKHVIEDDPENPKDLQQVFHKMRKGRPVINIYFHQDDHHAKERWVLLPGPGVTHTGIMGIYAKADEVKEVLKVFMRMLSLGVAPNAYTNSVLIKALAKDPNFLGDVKMYTLEMMDKGMRPNARTYTAVFKAFARLN
ncbi:putative pentatricopeptide [Rosa chinensis]|uniref:Putative pentatricopeptide n=1 Tax=Rosa chinensis TaxID=74649 RepID=A0A2P6R843_ROSCH|nr:putative pentatricopeptide [Rosa chinensis]